MYSSVPAGSLWRVLPYVSRDLFASMASSSHRGLGRGVKARNVPTVSRSQIDFREFEIKPGTLLMAAGKMNCPDNPFHLVVRIVFPQEAYIDDFHFCKDSKRIERVA